MKMKDSKLGFEVESGLKKSQSKYSYEGMCKLYEGEEKKTQKEEIKSRLLGKKVNIKPHVDCHGDSWGIIVMYDGDHYHIAMFAGDPHAIFKRNEFTVPKNQWYYGKEKHHQAFLDKFGIKESK